jgi:lipid-A-disaccharide synthase
MSLCVMLVAVEASGDALGADLMQSLRATLGAQVRFVGAGGPLMERQGFNSAFDVRDLSVLGLLDGLMAFRRASRRARNLAALAARERPDVAVLIDAWGFSYLTAKALRKRLPGLKLVKYVAPQVWATRPGRAEAAARTFDLLLSVVPFEAPLFEAAGARVKTLAYPGVSRDFTLADPSRLRRRIGAGKDDPILLVLPGSRPSELHRMMGPFRDAARLLKAGRPALQVVVGAAPTVAAEVATEVAGWGLRAHVVEDATGRDDAMAAADVALACSGTVTAELAAAGCPMVVAYRLGPISYRIARRIVRTRYITLFNIAADAEVAPELIQQDCNGPRLARELAARLDDPRLRKRQAKAQLEAVQRLGLGLPPPAQEAARAIAELIAQNGEGEMARRGDP